MTCTTTTGVAPAELISGHLPLMQIEENVQSWRTIEWQDRVSREELLERRIEHFNQTEEKIKEALHRLKEAREKNKERFDKTHRLRPIPIKEGDWVLIYKGGLEQQHSTIKKFARRWRGPFVVKEVRPNTTYVVRELDGTIHRYPYTGKRVKLFKRRMHFTMEEEIETDDLEILEDQATE
ncbi:unnamed protein product [Calypogeia fissa]